MNNSRLFQTREARDRAFKELIALGIPKRNITRTTYRDQCLHPMYVEDFQGSEKHDTGFGNMAYKTLFSVLYALEIWR